MSDTSKENMLGRLDNIRERVKNEKARIADITNNNEDINVLLENVEGKIAELISTLPNKIYNFKANDYTVCYNRLNEIIKDIEKVEKTAQKLKLGIKGLEITSWTEIVKSEIEICINKAENKANK